MATDITVNLTPAVELDVTIDRTGAQGIPGVVQSVVAGVGITVAGTAAAPSVTLDTATDAEMIAGTIATKAGTPAGVFATMAAAHGLDPGHVAFPGTTGNNLSTPHSSELNLGLDRTYVFRLRSADWARDLQTPVSKVNNLRVYLRPSGASNYFGVYYYNATGAITLMTTPVFTRPAVGAWKWFAMTQRLDNGAGSRELRLFDSPDGTTWTQVGATTTLAGVETSVGTGLDNSLFVASVNAGSVETYQGDIGHVSIRNGVGAAGIVGGTEVFRFDGLELSDVAATSFVAASGHTVTVNRSGTPATAITKRSFGRRATAAETIAGVDTTKAVTSAGVAATLPFFDVRRSISGLPGAALDGVTDDSGAWQRAVDFVAGIGGGTVVVGRGGVSSVTAVTLKSGVHINLNGGTLKARSAVSSVIVTPGTTAGAHVSDCGVFGGTIDTNGLANRGVWAQDADRVTVDGCTIINPHPTAFNAVALTEDTVECTVSNNVIRLLLDVPFQTVPNNVGIACESRLVDSNSGGLNNTLTFVEPTNLSARHHIFGNTISNGTHGIAVSGTEGITISDNYVEGQSHRCIILSPRVSRTTITGNVLKGFGSTGIHLALGTCYNTITGNILRTTVSASEGDGIKGYFGCSHNVVTGNYVQGVNFDGPGSPNSLGAGIRFATSSMGNVISGNRIVGCNRGILIQDKVGDTYYQPTTPPAVVGGVIANNLIDGGGIAAAVGIRILERGGLSMSKITLTGNTIFDANLGVDIVEGTPGTVFDLAASGNNVSAVTRWAMSRNVKHFATAAANVGLPDRAGDLNFTPSAVGQWYLNPLTRSNRTLVPTLNRLHLYPVYSGADGVTISDLDVNVTVVGAAGAVARGGLWLLRDYGRPFTWTNATVWADLLVDGGTVATDVGIGQKIINIVDTVIPPNSWFAVGVAHQVATAATCNVEGLSGSSWWSPFGTLSSGGIGAGGGPGLALYADAVTGAFVATATPTGSSNTGGGVGFKRSV